jgi:uracil-DNA glycosylase
MEPLAGWPELQAELKEPYMQELSAFLKAEGKAGRRWYPPAKDMFKALETTPLATVRCVIIGQDPYHGPGQAMGLSFSVPNELEPKPPSLRNIFKEIADDLGQAPPQSNLTPWAEDGVLLLNNVLTVGAGQAASHHGKGWERFTDRVVDLVNAKDGVVFLLWGRPAQSKGARVDRSRQLVLETVHPSPLSAHKGFFGSKHFSQTNRYLEDRGQAPVDWTMQRLSS